MSGIGKGRVICVGPKGVSMLFSIRRRPKARPDIAESFATFFLVGFFEEGRKVKIKIKRKFYIHFLCKEKLVFLN